MTKMNPEIKARWVAALRSGEYKQAKKTLRSTSGGFCCLGVLCDVLAPADWDCNAHLSEINFPSQSIRLQAGFPLLGGEGWARIPEVDIRGERLTLDEHNDSGRSFAEIADAIEAQL